MTRLRRIFPTATACPSCGRVGHQHVGTSSAGGIQYRACLHCGERYRVLPLAVEEQADPQQPSTLRVLQP